MLTDFYAMTREGRLHTTGTRPPLWKRIWLLYYDGFRNMTVGKSLWILIIIKLFIFFVIIKWLFFPNILKENYTNDDERASAVRHELMK